MRSLFALLLLLSVAVTEAAPLESVIIPALSPLRMPPDEFPADGRRGDALTILMAPNEIGHAAFLLQSAASESGVTIAVSPLRGKAGLLQPSAVDLRIVKYHYQDGTAWNSYFADPLQQELVPELLIHDDALLKVDHAKRSNYLRVGDRYRWMSYPESVKPKPFNFVTEPVRDTEKLAPFALEAGRYKRFFVTVKVPHDTPAGVYDGTLTVAAGSKELGKLTLKVRILPFLLPEPKTWYDLDKTFYASVYMPPISAELRMANGDFDTVMKRRNKLYRNMLDHNLRYPLVDSPDRKKLSNQEAEELFARDLELMKRCGFPTDELFGGINAISWYLAARPADKRPAGVEEKFYAEMDRDLATIRRIMGDSIRVWPVGWDEPSMAILKGQRELWSNIHKRGMNVMSTASRRHLANGAYYEDFANYAGRLSSSKARIWHGMGNRITNYANPHTGPENPDYMRRTHGMALYKADYDGTCNYHLLENGTGNIWRDTNGTFRSFALVYPTQDGVIDTLQYEGFRAAIDDIRYATLLKTLAGQAIRSGDTDARYAGKKALRFLALVPADRVNLDTLRLEMIGHILQLQRIVAAKPKGR